MAAINPRVSCNRNKNNEPVSFVWVNSQEVTTANWGLGQIKKNVLLVMGLENLGRISTLIFFSGKKYNFTHFKMHVFL